jgi:hypothetical protein
MVGPRLGENRGRTQAVLPPKFFVNIGYKRVCFGVQQADLAAGSVGHIGADGGADPSNSFDRQRSLLAHTNFIARRAAPGTERSGRRYVRQMRPAWACRQMGRQDVPHPANFVSGHIALRLRGGPGRGVSAAPVCRGGAFRDDFGVLARGVERPRNSGCAATTSASSATSRDAETPVGAGSLA